MFGLFRAYHRVLAVIGRGSPILWDHSGWPHLRARTQELIRETLSISVHTRQIQPASKGEIDASATGLPVEPPLHMNKRSGASGVMIDFEIISPSRAECLKTHRLPEVYLQVTNPNSTQVQYRFDQVLHLICSPKFWKTNAPKLQKFLAAICDIAEVKFLAHTRSRYSSLNEFESFLLYQFFYPELANSEIPDINRIKGSWKPIRIAELSQL